LDFSEYLKSLSHDLIHSYVVQQTVEFDVKADHLDLSNRYFVPIALLCNELISNSLKHAFSHQDSGKISVELEQKGDGSYVLTYCDNGAWKLPAESKPCGMELIDALAEQLNGQYGRVSHADCAVYRFRLSGHNDYMFFRFV